MRPGSDADGNTCTVQGDARITPIGRLLRKTKLDELPQLFNVFKGEMSLVGPRPEVARYVELFREDYKTVLSVRPGITDYAAIEYRDEEGILQRLGGETAGQRETERLCLTTVRFSTRGVYS
jgi:lipopolysaccharide/colanic/teichoic acid biosynthesis glycosyltransferase